VIAVVLIVLVVLWLAIGYAVGGTAERYGRHAFPWTLLGFVIGLFAFIPLLAAGPTEDERLRRITVEEEERLRVREALGA
jgi:hypothetical protein